MTEIALTDGQEAAAQAFSQFYLDPKQDVFVLEGYSGTGKTTLVKYLLDLLPKVEKTLKLLQPKREAPYELVLTATTNKAAENFAQLSGMDVKTIHSHLQLRVNVDYATGTTELMPKPKQEMQVNQLILIDEASYIDQNLLDQIKRATYRCKIVMIGDPAQLLNVGCTKSPVFDAGWPGAQLTEVVRQAKGNPIIDLATNFRETVNTGQWFAFTPDGHHIQHMDRPDFEQAVIDEFTRSDWSHQDSKVLAWTNKTVIAYNRAINNLAAGDPDLQEGDYAVVNQYIGTNGKGGFKTDQTVQITQITTGISQHSVNGKLYEINEKSRFFMPDSRVEWRERINVAQRDSDLKVLQEIREQWIDLRSAYALTINKSQGSTYDKVFIDLDDLKKCRDGNQLARMLYVGNSRARYRVYLTGDLV